MKKIDARRTPDSGEAQKPSVSSRKRRFAASKKVHQERKSNSFQHLTKKHGPTCLTWNKKRAANLGLQLLYSYWCPGGDSNSHAIRRYHLKIVCLPIPPPGHEVQLIEKRPRWQAFFHAFSEKNTNRFQKSPFKDTRGHAAGRSPLRLPRFLSRIRSSLL